ncbi:unnamed protein product [Blepharisma stoltei]|uniref:phosphatidylserine decarboxylase n=1 Tax=Blepharisma stoltei TaxID=1481888 RepID=A0AAU9K3W7_9CILI|nr:unnamed protein product [Blepharisma stoltei]
MSFLKRILSKIYQQAKYPDEGFSRNSIKVLFAFTMLPIIYSLKGTDKNTKYVLSLSRSCSRIYGAAFRIPIPQNWRASIYGGFSSIFGVNLSEIKKPITEFETLNEFFVREIKEDARVIGKGDLVSPCDGRVMSMGIVENNKIDSVKGRDYLMTRLLIGTDGVNFDWYVDSVKKNKENQLYYVNLYLAPGDYHRFHSPTEWRVSFRRHIYGYLLGVFPLNIWRKGDVFTINERVAYFGEWKHGLFNYVAVGAFNVGSIEVNFDKELKTNLKKFENLEKTNDEINIEGEFKKGEEFGRFNTGSTIIMIFEAPKGLEWTIQRGDRVLLGQNLLK